MDSATKKACDKAVEKLEAGGGIALLEVEEVKPIFAAKTLAERRAISVAMFGEEETAAAWKRAGHE